MNPLLNAYAVLILILIAVMGIALVYTWLTTPRPPAPGPASAEETEGTTVVIHISWFALKYQLRELRRRIATARITTAERVIVKSVLGSRLIQVEEAPPVGQAPEEEEDNKEEQAPFHSVRTQPLPVVPVAPPVPSLSLKELIKSDPALFDTVLYGLVCRIYLLAEQEGGRITRDAFVRNSKLHSPEEQRRRISPSEWNLLMREGEGWFWQAKLLEREEGFGVILRLEHPFMIVLDENGTPYPSGAVIVLMQWIDDHWHELRSGQN